MTKDDLRAIRQIVADGGATLDDNLIRFLEEKYPHYDYNDGDSAALARAIYAEALRLEEIEDGSPLGDVIWAVTVHAQSCVEATIAKILGVDRLVVMSAMERCGYSSHNDEVENVGIEKFCQMMKEEQDNWGKDISR